MNDAVAKRVKELRLSRNMTQDDLAQQLHVTRQAVSNWEMGKTAISVEYLMQLAKLFNVTTDELLYGEEVQTEQKYQEKQRRYVVCAAVCGTVLLAAILLDLTVKPGLLKQAEVSYQILPYLIYVYLVGVPATAAVGGLIPSLLALKLDIRLYGAARYAALIAGIFCLLFWLIACVGPVFGFASSQLVNLFTKSVFLMRHANFVFPFFFGAGMFLGLNH